MAMRTTTWSFSLASLMLPLMGQAQGLAPGQELARVLSSTPVIQKVATPRQICNTAQVVTPGQPSGAGALLGALAGGAVGHNIGQGNGRVAATALGLLGGAIAGNNLEGSPPPTVQNVQQCSTQTFFEDKLVGYNVVYEYAGKQYSVQMPNNPGPTLAIQVGPVANANQLPPVPAYNSIAYGQTVYQPVAPAVVATYPPAYYPPYYPPVGLSFGFGYGCCNRGHGERWHGEGEHEGEHGHWR